MMIICAAIGSSDELKNIGNADMAEIRLDVFDDIPEGIGKTIVLKVDTKEQLEKYSQRSINGFVDIGEMKKPDDMKNKVISSYHDMEKTPSTEKIAEILNGFDCDIAKGAFMINNVEDLVKIYDASKLIEKRHVLLGMGNLGQITRLRPDILKNEFTFAHTGTPTADGQMSVENLVKLKNNCMITGLIGHPVGHSLSKAMHTQAMKDEGIEGIYLNMDITSIDGIGDVIRNYDIRGLNVTMPYKKDIMTQLDSVDSVASEIGAVNTVINDNGKLTGTNTDVSGVEFAFERTNVDPNGKKIAIMGSGGSARACAYLFSKKNADISIAGRNSETVKDICDSFGCSSVTDSDPSKYDIIVNCTPIGMYTDAKYPLDIEKISERQVVFDVTYGIKTPLGNMADERNCRKIFGLDMLIGQGMKSFELWTGVAPDYDSIKRSII